MKGLKAITYGECPEPEIYKGPLLFSKSIEQAGRGYEEFKLKMHLIKTGMFKEKEEKEIPKEDSDNKKDSQEEIEIDEEKMKNKKRKRKMSMNLKNNVNFYELMGFKDWGEDFSEKTLKKKYMKLALKYHPDKMGDQYDEEAKKKWLLVRKYSIRTKSKDPRCLGDIE
jgi:hypothetical protein